MVVPLASPRGTWIRLDDQMFDHPKTLALVDDDVRAALLHIAAICWCSRFSTDGAIPGAAFPSLAAKVAAGQDQARVLVDHGHWKPTETGWQIHDYLDWQQSKEEVEAKRAQDRERKRRQRDKERDADRAPPDVTPGVTRDGTRESQRSETETETENNSRITGEGFAEFWALYPRRDGKKLERAKALQQWKKLSTAEKAAAMVGVKNYADSGVRAKDAFRWLRDECWPDWQTPADTGQGEEDEPWL